MTDADHVLSETLPDPTVDELAPLDESVDDVDADVPDDETPTARQTLRYYGVDFDVEGLVRRYERKDLTVPSFDPASETDGVEGFQRRFVWPKKQMDRFVESLLLGYPVPGIFLVEQANRRFLVLDGQQRLHTLNAFYQGSYGAAGSERIFRLEYVGEELRGLTYKTLPDPDKRLLDTTILQATIVVPQEGGLGAVYRVFERINSSGIKLQPQEIRVALFSGPLIRLLRDLNGTRSWRAMFGPAHSRLKDHELILRYLALAESTEQLERHAWDREAARAQVPEGASVYRPAMTSFLNRFLDRHQQGQGLDADGLRLEFSHITAALNESGGRGVLRFSGTQVNAAHTDAVLVGAALAHRKGLPLTPQSCSAALSALLADANYRSAVVESTSHLDSVTTRLKLATEVFAHHASQ